MPASVTRRHARWDSSENEEPGAGWEIAPRMWRERRPAGETREEDANFTGFEETVCGGWRGRG
jgi:hypothetical protein